MVDPATPWSPATPEELPAADQALWAALDGGPRAWTGECRAAPPAFRRLVIIGEAPRSQLDALQQALGAGLDLDGPVACLALTGRRFRGQRGRAWAVVPGNLFLTVALAPDAPVRRLVPGLTMLPALAVADAIRTASGDALAPGIKWVNDVLLDGRKVAGVLTTTHVQGETVRAAVLGIGVNVAAEPAIEPTPFVPAAGSLAGAGLETDLWELLPHVLDALAARAAALLAGGSEALLPDYREASVVVGRRVHLWDEAAAPDDAGAWPAPLASGRVVAIEPDLSLRLEGLPEPIAKGRLALAD